MKRMPKFGPRYGFKKFAAGGSMPPKKDRVQEAVDATKRYQDAAERRYKYNTSDPIAFLNEYGQERTYNTAAARAEKDMKEKASAAKAERAASDATKKRATDKKAEALAKKAEKYAPGTDPDQKSYQRGGSLPDLTGDGKITRADVLKGRGVFKYGGKVQKYAGGGSVKSSASRRADGIAQRGKTRGRVI